MATGTVAILLSFQQLSERSTDRRSGPQIDCCADARPVGQRPNPTKLALVHRQRPPRLDCQPVGDEPADVGVIRQPVGRIFLALLAVCRRADSRKLFHVGHRFFDSSRWGIRKQLAAAALAILTASALIIV